MTDDVRRDATISGALDSIAVPDYRPGFWERLDAKLGAEGFPGLDVTSLEAAPAEPEPVAVGVASVPVLEAVAAASPAPEPVLAELAVVVPAARRRGVALLAAAAAVALAVLALQVADRGPSDPLETASGGPSVTQGAPRGGSTTARDASEDGEEVPPRADAAEGDSVPDEADGGATGTPSPSRPHQGGAGASDAGASSPALGTSATGTAVDDGTPRAAVASWATALDAGDVEGALALTGPRTVSYHQAAGSDVDVAAAGWAETYGAWAEADGDIDTIQAAPSAGDPVVVLLLDGSALPVVQTDAGWRVEPDARTTAEPEAVALASPTTADSGEPRPVPASHVIEVAAAKRGTYTLALDGGTTTTISAGKAQDGVIRWDPPDSAMTVGRHELVVVHVTDTTITTLTTTFEVA